MGMKKQFYNTQLENFCMDYAYVFSKIKTRFLTSTAFHHFSVYQRSPVGVQVAYFQCWYKLWARHDEKIEVQEKLELLI